MSFDALKDKLPWRLQSQLGFRPKKAIFSSITKHLPETKDNIPFNSWKKIENGYQIGLKKPEKYLNDFRHHFFLENHELEVEPVIFASISKARVNLTDSIPSIIDKNNCILDGALRHPYYYNPWKKNYTFPQLSVFKLPQPKRLKGNVFSLMVDGGHNGFFHILGRSLPRFAILEKLNIPLDFFSYFIINGPETPYKKDGLEKIGIPPEKIVFVNEGEQFICDTLFFTPRIRYHQLGIDYIREQFISENDDIQNPGIYLSRKDADHRKLLEENILEKSIAKKGIVSTSFRGKSLTEQADIFNSSKNIISVHGAGLTNILFAQKNSTLIEILDDSFVNVGFWFLSNIAGVNYIPVIGKSIKNNTKTRNGFDDVSLQLEMIEKISESVDTPKIRT